MLDRAVTGYLSPEELKELDRLADQKSLSRSAMVRYAVISMLKIKNKKDQIIPAPYTDRRKKSDEELKND